MTTSYDHLGELDAKRLGVGDFDVGLEIEAWHISEIRGRGCS